MSASFLYSFVGRTEFARIRGGSEFHFFRANPPALVEASYPLFFRWTRVVDKTEHSVCPDFALGDRGLDVLPFGLRDVRNFKFGLAGDP